MLPDDYLGPVQRELERMQRYNDLIYSPVQELVDQQRRMAELVAGPALELQHMMTSIAESESFAAVRRMMEQREALLAQTRVLEASSQIEEATRSWAGSFDGIRRFIEESTRIADELRWTGQIAGIAAISEENLRLMEVAGTALHHRLATFEAAASVEERQAVLPLLLRALIEWVDTLPPGLLSKQVIGRVVNIFLSLVAVYGLVSGEMLQESVEDWQESDAAHHEEVEALLEELNERMDAMAPAIDVSYLFRTTCPLPLRVAPHGKARRLGTVPVDVLVEQMDQQGRWLSIVYLDLQSGVPVVGWIYKRGLMLADDAAADETSDMENVGH